VRALMGVALAAAVMAAAPAFGQQQSLPAESPGKWGGFLDLEGKLGTDRHLGEADLFVPVFQDERSLLFANVKARLDDNASKEGNFGAGVRHMHTSGWNLGAYGFFDRRRTENDHLFNQMTFGAEALGEDFDFRVNSYWPIGRKVKLVDSLNTAEISGTSVVFKGGEERALQGFDAEVGWRVPVFEAGGPIDLRLYAGGYTFDDDTVDAVTGPRLRAELIAYEMPELWEGARITLGAEWQHDEPRGSQGFASLRLRIPLQPEKERGRKLTVQERRMTAPVVRDVDIVAQAGAFGAPETATQLANGNTFTVFNSATTTGAALPGAIAGAGNNVILAGTFNTVALVQVNNGQSVMAGNVTVRSPSGRTAVLSTPATVSSSDAVTNTIQLAGNNTLSGLTIIGTDTGGGARGILMNSTAGNINVLNNTITMTQTGANGIVGIGTDRNNNIVISGNTITVTGGTTGTALGLSGTGAQTATVTGNTLSVSAGSTNNFAVNVSNYTINAGSTGNVLSAGACNNGGAVTGSIGFTNGTTCP
jgi:hypothetical protein